MENIKLYNNTIQKKPFILKGFFVLLFCTFSFLSNAQLFDSIKVSLKKKPRPEFKFDSRHSFISADLARIYGIKAGLEYNKMFSVGVGYNWLSSNISTRGRVLNSRDEFETVEKRLRFEYITPYAQYDFYINDPWRISILALVGVGRSYFTYSDRYSENLSSEKKWVFMYEPYMSAEYKFLKYFGVGAGVGYRLSFSVDKLSRQKLNSPIYVFKFKMYLTEFYRDNIKPRLKK